MLFSANVANISGDAQLIADRSNMARAPRTSNDARSIVQSRLFGCDREHTMCAKGVLIPTRMLLRATFRAAKSRFLRAVSRMTQVARNRDRASASYACAARAAVTAADQ
jgi:hypothetical protein